MSKKDSGQLKETEAEKSAAQMNLNQYIDYKKRWLPIQQQAIRLVEGYGGEESWERERAKSRAVGATGVAYDQATDAVETSQRNRGIDAGSSNFKLAQADMGAQRAKGTGIAAAGAADAIDAAYVDSLSGLMRIGRNQASQAIEGVNKSAGIGAANEAAGAEAAAARRAGNAELAGTVVGAAGTYFKPQITAAVKRWMQGKSGFGFESGVQNVPGVDI